MQRRSIGIAVIYSLSLFAGLIFAQTPLPTVGGSTYSVVIAGLKNYAPHKELKELFNSNTDKFQSGRESEFAQGKIVFKVVFSGSLSELASRLNSVQLSGATLRVVAAQGTEVRLEAK